MRDKLRDQHFTRLARMLEGITGIQLPPTKRVMIEGRLRRRMRQLDIAYLEDYGIFLFDKDGLDGELPFLIDCATTNKTDFFREPDHFVFLRDHAVPTLLRRSDRDKPDLKIWSAASSTGAEAYTVAMVLARMQESGVKMRFAILGTDISAEILQSARRAIYPSSMLEPISADMQTRYVLKAADPARQEFRIAPQLRRFVHFASLNLMDESYPFDRDVDIIFCRNVLIYFSRTAQQAVLRRLASHLRPGRLFDPRPFRIIRLGRQVRNETSLADGLRANGTVPNPEGGVMRNGGKIRVLIIDDSASVRQALVSVISSAPDMDVMATASDPFIAAQRIHEEVPDVIILDVEMPRMDGITFLKKLMSQRPIPTILCSTLVEKGSDTALEGLDAGAIELIVKPRLDTKQFLMESQIRICDAVRAAAAARPSLTKGARSPLVQKKLTADVMMPAPQSTRAMTRTTEKVVCIGASTGGTESLREVLIHLPINSPGIIVVQHMPELFTAAFARRLDGLCKVDVREAKDGDPVLPGQVLIAPGNRHMLLQRSGARYHVAIKDGPLVSRHRPSVDVLFRSAALHSGSNALGIIMTGMGDDGAKGMLEMHNAGAKTVAQNEETCVVFGMPKEAIALGGVDTIVPLSDIPAAILDARS